MSANTDWTNRELVCETYERMEDCIKELRDAVLDRSLSDARDALDRFDERQHYGLTKDDARYWWCKGRRPMMMADPYFYPGVL